MHGGPTGPECIPHWIPWPSSPGLPVPAQVRKPCCAKRAGIGGDSQIPIGSGTGTLCDVTSKTLVGVSGETPIPLTPWQGLRTSSMADRR